MTSTLEDIFALEAAGHFKEAEAGYLAFLKHHPEDVKALHHFAMLLTVEEEFNRAAQLLEKACKLQPDNAEFKFYLANVYKLSSEMQKAESTYKELLQQKGPHPALFNNLGTIYFAQERYQDAITNYYAAIDLQPNYIDAYYNLALALNKLRDYQKSIEVLTNLLALSPTHLPAWFQLGVLYMRQDKNKDAIKAFEHVLQESPHFETLVNMATVYLKAGDMQKAKNYYQQALQIEVSDAQTLFNLGVIALSERKLKEAINYFLGVVKKMPEHVAAHNNLAYVYLLLNQRSEALAHFSQIKQLEPENKAIDHTIKILHHEPVSDTPIEYVEALFDSYADHFDAHLQNVLHYQVPQLFKEALITEGVQLQDMSVLDLGCGTGLCGSMIADEVGILHGVDASSKMLEAARAKNCYDQLVKADILEFLQQTEALYDLIMAGDVIVYQGALQKLFEWVYHRLRPEGIFLFNIEAGENMPYKISDSGRFKHHKAYIDAILHQYHFKLLHFDAIVLRSQADTDVKGYLFMVQKH